MLLENKNVFITGGSSGLGKSTVIQLVKEGANVAFTYASNNLAAEKVAEEAQLINPDAKILYYQLDVRSTEQVDAVVRTVLDDYESIHGVVNNAGIAINKMAYRMLDEEWDDVIDVNLTGTFRVCRAFLKEFAVKKYGKFINVSSISYAGGSGFSCYSAAKAGVIGFTISLAKEYGMRNIYSNVIVPGIIEAGISPKTLSGDLLGKIKTHTSLKRLGQPDEFAQAVVFLLSDYSSFVNGEVLHVTGGLNAVPIA